jgi:hypothetical protein
MTNPDKPYILLRPLPLYKKLTINTKRFWLNSLGLQDESWDKLMKDGWFK